MTDPRPGADGRRAVTLREAAELTGGRVEVGGGDWTFGGVAPLDEAGPSDLALVAAKRYVAGAPGSAAGGFLVQADLEDHVPEDRPRLVVDDAHVALYHLLRHMTPPEPARPGVHPTAVVAEGVRLGKDVEVAAYAVLEADAGVGDGTRIGAHAVVGRGVQIGSSCVLHPHVVLYPGTVLGDRVILHAGARVGVEGFGWAEVGGVPRKMPHVGGCILEDDVEVGANSTVDRGSIGNTMLRSHAKLDNLVHVAHNVDVGRGSLLAALVGVAGSTHIGDGVQMGGQSGAINHIRIGPGARIAAATAVMKSVEPGETVSGVPARPNRDYLRKQAHMERLPRLLDRVRDLESRLAATSSEGDAG